MRLPEQQTAFREQFTRSIVARRALRLTQSDAASIHQVQGRGRLSGSEQDVPCLNRMEAEPFCHSDQYIIWQVVQAVNYAQVPFDKVAHKRRDGRAIHVAQLKANVRVGRYQVR